MANSRRHELELDLKELTDLIKNVTRTAIREELVRIQNEILTKIAELPEEEKKEAKPRERKQESKYIPIEKYAWEQTFENLKIYVTSLEGVKNLPEDSVVLKFDEESIDVKVLDLNRKNFRLRVPKLFKPITRCRLTKKSNGFSLTVTKKDSMHWDQIPYKQPPFKKSKVEEKVDPSAGLMEMMKEMYQSGDEDLKRTIEEAWTKSRQEKQNK